MLVELVGMMLGVVVFVEPVPVPDGATPTSAIVLHVATSEVVASPTEGSSAEDVMHWLFARGTVRTREQVDVAEQVLAAATKKEPGNARWLFGRAMALRANGKRTPAREMMERVVKLVPEDAAYQFWYGMVALENIDDVPTLKQMGLSSSGKSALEKSLKLDPDQPLAVFTLARFYIEAPGIAGGSLRKAREQAGVLMAMKDGKGEFLAHLALALAAAEASEWKEMAKEFDAAEGAGGEGADPKAALAGHIECLLETKEDPKAAIPIIERYLDASDSTDERGSAWLGEAKRRLKDYEGAIEPFAKAVEMNRWNKVAVWGLAECAEKTGDAVRAAGEYRAFAERWPEDERAAKARSNAERLERRKK